MRSINSRTTIRGVVPNGEYNRLNIPSYSLDSKLGNWAWYKIDQHSIPAKISSGSTISFHTHGRPGNAALFEINKLMSRYENQLDKKFQSDL